MTNEHYKERYGAWAGNPAGHKPDFKLCCAEVRKDWHYYQCSRSRGHGPDGAYCKTHDPAAIAERERVRQEKWNAQHNESMYGWNGKKFFNVLQQIADGHNDARGLAQKTIEEFMKGMR